MFILDGPQVKEIVGDPARSDGRLRKGDLLMNVSGQFHLCYECGYEYVSSSAYSTMLHFRHINYFIG